MLLDFNNHLAAQDMITIIKKDKSLSEDEAIRFSINQDIYDEILSAGWTSIALDLWGHDDPEREWGSMDNPCVEINIEDEKIELINNIAKNDKIDIEKSISYFLIFTMQELGYHI